MVFSAVATASEAAGLCIEANGGHSQQFFHFRSKSVNMMSKGLIWKAANSAGMNTCKKKWFPSC